jgi:4-hydroxybenzoate polyprenyltransferase
LIDETDRVRLIRGLLRATHFEPTLAVTAATTALAIQAGRGWGSIWVATAVLCGQASVGWSNDWFDADRDRKAGRIEKPVVAGLISVDTLRSASLLALALAIPLSLMSGWKAAIVHLVAIGSAWSYNAGLKARLISPVPYALSFALLPAFITLGLEPPRWPRPLIMMITGLLGVAFHLINTIGDHEADRINAIDGLPQRVGPRWSLIASVALFVVAIIALWSLSDHAPILRNAISIVGLGLGGAVVWASRRGHALRAQRLAIGVVICCLVLFVIEHPSLTVGG